MTHRSQRSGGLAGTDLTSLRQERVQAYPRRASQGPLAEGDWDSGRCLALFAEHAADGAQELQRAIGLGDVVIAARPTCLFLVTLHGE